MAIAAASAEATRRTDGVLSRAVSFGAGIGALVGCGVGTAIDPILGSFFGAISASIEAVVAPFATFGAEPLTFRSWDTARPLSEFVVRALAIGASGGALLGGAGGLLIGHRTHAPSAPAAVVEDALFGVVGGLVVALLFVVVVMCPKLRVGR